MSAGRLPIETKDMPASLQEVARLCGVHVALALSQHFAGQRVWVPLTLPPEHSLYRIGDAEAKSLVEQFGYNSIDVPISLLSSAGKRRLVGLLVTSGAGQGEIAATLGMSQRSVSRIERKWFPELRKAIPCDSDGGLTGCPENFRSEVAERSEMAASGHPARSRLH